MTVITVMGLKGGVGKTSVVLGLAGAATQRGLSTLVIDLDPQANATSILATKVGSKTAADVLANPTAEIVEAALATCDWEFGAGEVDVIPSDPSLVLHDSVRNQFKPRLPRAINHLGAYDLILFDCPPSHGSLVREALAASDGAVIVSTPSFFGGQGVDRAAETVSQVRHHHNRDLTLAGIIVNRVRSNVDEHAYRIKELGDVHGKPTILQPVLPERVAVQQAESVGQPIQSVHTAGAREIAAIFDTYLTTILRRLG